MAASQARLLSITARLSDNENSGQSISYAKIKLSDQTEQANNEYNEALKATKLTVITGYSDAVAQYTDLSYNLITSVAFASSQKQYIVTDTSGAVMVSEKLADAYTESNGDYNNFLAQLGYSQADVTFKSTDTTVSDEDKEAMEQKIHDAWDNYFASVGIEIGDDDSHDIEDPDDYTFDEVTDEVDLASDDVSFNYESFGSVGTGYAYYTSADGVDTPINFEGTTQTQKDLYTYALALTEAYYSEDMDLDKYNMASDSENTQTLAYYKNLYDEMTTNGYFAYTDDYSKADASNNYKYISDSSFSPENDMSTFESMLQSGELALSYYNVTDDVFESTSITEDVSILEVSDDTAIALADSDYTQALTELEYKDAQYDMELASLDTEHSSLQTEYDSVKAVLDENIENSFTIFS